MNENIYSQKCGFTWSRWLKNFEFSNKCARTFLVDINNSK